MFLTINDPIDNKCIPLFSNEVMNLLNNGYSIYDVMNLSKKVPLKYNRDNIFHNDLLINYIVHLDINDMKSLALIDKSSLTLLHDKSVWNKKIVYYLNKYYPTGVYNGENTLQGYNKCIYAINRFKLVRFERV